MHDGLHCLDAEVPDPAPLRKSPVRVSLDGEGHVIVRAASDAPFAALDPVVTGDTMDTTLLDAFDAHARHELRTVRRALQRLTTTPRAHRAGARRATLAALHALTMTVRGMGDQ